MKLYCFKINIPPRKLDEHDDIGWKHEQSLEGNLYGIKCNYYGMETQYWGISKRKQHLSHVGPDVIGCRVCPTEISNTI